MAVGINMIKTVVLAVFLCIANIGAANAQVNVNVYQNQYVDNGSGFTFTGAPDSTETWSAINSNILYPGWQWMPGNVFSADITATINVSTDGTYNFNLTSDDGSYAFIDGILVGNDGGIHGAATVPFSDFLTAGNHSIEVQFGNYYCCGSGVQLDSLVNAVPEPETYSLMLAGLGLLGWVGRRRKQKAA